MLKLDLGDANKVETMAEIETVLAQSPQNMHWTSAEPNILKTPGYRILTVKLQSMSTCSNTAKKFTMLR